MASSLLAQARRVPALVADRRGKATFVEERSKGVEGLGRPSQALAERGRTERRDHELLEVGGVDGVLAAVQDVDQWNRQSARARSAEVAVERQPDSLGRSVRGRQADSEERVGAELRLVRRAVKVDEQPVEADLVESVDPEQLRPDRVVDVAHGRQHALAAVPLRVAVAQLDRFVCTGRGSGRDHGGAHGAVRQEQVDLDGRVAARVEDLASDDVLDQAGHTFSSPKVISASPGSRAATPGQDLALDELERCAAAGAHVGHLVRQPELLDGCHRIPAAHDRDRAPGGAPGNDARHLVRPIGELRYLEDAHRSVPEDRLRLCQVVGVGPAGLGADVDDHLVLRNLRRPARPGSWPDVDLGRDDGIGRKHEPDALAARLRQDRLDVLELLRLDQALPELETARREERVGHPAADEDRLAACEERGDHLELAGDLGPSDDGVERPRRPLQEPRQRLDLAFHQKARHRRQVVGDALRAWHAPDGPRRRRR